MDQSGTVLYKNFFATIKKKLNKNGESYRKKNSTNTKERGNLRLLSAPARYIKRKIKSVYRK